ncbi:copper resistance protein CopC [Actinokineospora guangxiensis]|uniref:Copper resistance protein CopC n=1 Tax=Actinokineospora guangxiensis TaxID=1490288 RepID=A0ABW0EMQ7_9PSEU
MIRRLATATIAAAFATVVATAPASAHERLVSADPEQGVALDTAPTTVTLTFSGKVEANGESIRITGRDGTDWAVSDVASSGAEVTAKVTAQGQPGKQVLAYRVTSADGHTLTGTYTFDVAAFASTTTTQPTTQPTTTQPPSTQPPATQPTTAAQPTTAVPVADSPAPDEPGGPGAVLWIVLGAAVVAALGGIAAVVLKKRREAA